MAGKGALSGDIVSALLARADGVRRGFTTLLEPHGITLQQYNVLRILRGAGADGLPTLTVAERMMEKTPGITRLLDRLEAKGLVRRERSSEDRRLVRCSITKQGLGRLKALDETMDEADERVAASLTRKERRALLSLLEKIS